MLCLARSFKFYSSHNDQLIFSYGKVNKDVKIDLKKKKKKKPTTLKPKPKIYCLPYNMFLLPYCLKKYLYGEHAIYKSHLWSCVVSYFAGLLVWLRQIMFGTEIFSTWTFDYVMKLSYLPKNYNFFSIVHKIFKGCPKIISRSVVVR